MKNSGTCPKCESVDILRILNDNLNRGTNYVATGVFSSVNVARYVCERCGFSEEWIEYSNDIEKLRRRHVALSPQIMQRDEDERVDETAQCAKCHSALVEIEDRLRCIWCEDDAQNSHE